MIVYITQTIDGKKITRDIEDMVDGSYCGIRSVKNYGTILGAAKLIRFGGNLVANIYTTKNEGMRYNYYLSVKERVSLIAVKKA